jgi:DNA polymerase
MSIIVLDFETYYDKDYSLSKMTTEEYINDHRFECIGCSIKLDTSPAEWYSGSYAQIDRRLNSFDWEQSLLICHNTIFDAAILKWKFRIAPSFYADTLSMARALNGPDISVSLANLVRLYGVGTKGDEVSRAIGKRLKDFTAEEIYNYGEYCKKDTELTAALFKRMAGDFPASEMELVDQTIKMFVSPSLRLNSSLLQSRLAEIKIEKRKLLEDLMGALKCANADEVRVKLSSSNKFSEVLKNYGVEAPLKTNKNGRLIPALAKTDIGFIALEEHPDPLVQQLCAARLGTKSTIEESRIERFIGVGERNQGLLPVPLKYYAAHPGRWGGMDGINLQNLPARDARKKALKTSIIAPNGYVLLNADLSQIEARILAWLAGQDDVVEAFRQKRDIYCEDATKAFGRLITKQDIHERFIGKTCRLGLGYGTGRAKLHHTLKLGGADIDLAMCGQLVENWRRANIRIVDLWRQADQVLHHLMAWPEDGNSFFLGEHEVLGITPYGIHLPNDLYIRYNNLRMQDGKIIHDSRKGPVNIWGGTVTENVTQALARNVIADYMIKIRHRYTIALTVHDSLVCVIRKDQLDEAVSFIQTVMSTPPSWAPGLPVAVEIKTGDNYGSI